MIQLIIKGITALINAIKFLGDTAFTISLSASSIVCSTAFLLGKPPSLMMVLLPFLITYCVYNFDRLADRSGTDEKTTAQRSNTIKKYNTGIVVSVIIALSLAIIFSISFGLNVFLLMISFPFSVALYVLPIIPLTKIRCIKDVPYLKSFYVPACWCIIVLMGIQIAKVTFSYQAWFILIFVFLRIFIGALLGDIRDYEADLEAGNKTFASLLGKLNSYMLLHVLNIATIAFICCAIYFMWMPLTIVWLIPACNFGQIILFFFWRYSNLRELLGYIYDLEYISYFFLLWYGSQLIS